MQATAFAHDNEPVVVDATAGQFVAFSCGGTGYCLPIMTVREIRSWQPTTVLPGRISSARGVLDIRGTVVEVFDLSKLLGGPPIEPTAGSVVLVLALTDRVVGILVDAVSDIIQAHPGELMAVPDQRADTGSAGRVSAMISYQDRLIGILDLDVMFG
ncbi:MAG: chemotaxis protein CheW [Devosia sp.]